MEKKRYMKHNTTQHNTTQHNTTQHKNLLSLAKKCRSESLLVALFAVGTMIAFTGSAHAATPPDSCFNFNSGTNTIQDYYDNEGNNGTNPACPRDVDIPATIGGSAVTIIGSNAFRDQQLTHATIPNSVVSIGDSAFGENQLTSLTIPNSVATIGGNAFNANYLSSVEIGNSVTSIGSTTFSNNSITSVIIPNSVTSISGDAFMSQGSFGRAGYDAFVGGDSATILQFMGSVWYARLYTADPSNPNNLNDNMNLESDFATDLNGDGDQDDSVGGHLINPAQATLSFRDGLGNELSPSVTHTGTGLNDYFTKSNPDNDLDRYYRLGSQQAFTPPAINGFVTPANANFALDTAPTTNYSFVYQPNVVAGANTSSSKLAATGQALKTAVFAAVTLIFSGAFMTRRMLKKRV
jgi:hypothetical protein